MNQAKQKQALTRVGLFDSGVGGLSILRYLLEKSSNHNQNLKFVYLADTGRCPYGDRSAGEINNYVEQIVGFLNGAGVDRIVMACNTSAAVAAPLARQVSKVPVHDLISSAAHFAASNFKRIGVIATSTTCQSKAFTRAIRAQNPQSQVFELACPDLVPLVERGLLSGVTVEATIEKYTHQLNQFGIDSLIFGCTHFPFLEAAFRKQLPDAVTFIDPALHLGLEVLGNRTPGGTNGLNESDFQRNTYFCTGNLDNFARAAELCLKLPQGGLKDSICALDLQELQTINTATDLGENTVILQSPFSQGRQQQHGLLI